MKATSDFTQKQMSTTQLSLLFCMPEKMGQFIAVMASSLVNSSRTASEPWLVQKGTMRSPQLRSRSIAKSSSALQKIRGTCQLTASSKPSLMGCSDRVKSWNTPKKCYQPLLKADRQPRGTMLTTSAGTEDIPSCPRLRRVMIRCGMNSDTGKQA